MSSEFEVAIVGATGAVGAELIQLLEQREFPLRRLKLLASPKSAGKVLKFKGEEIPVEALSKDSFKSVDIALFSAGASTSRQYAQHAAHAKVQQRAAGRCMQQQVFRATLDIVNALSG